MVTHMERKTTFKNIFITVLMIIFTYVTVPKIIKFYPASLITWIMYAIGVAIYCVVLISIFHIVFEYNKFKTILARIKNI